MWAGTTARDLGKNRGIDTWRWQQRDGQAECLGVGTDRRRPTRARRAAREVRLELRRLCRRKFEVDGHGSQFDGLVMRSTEMSVVERHG